MTGPSPEDRILGCLLGGAVGDALGADIEFMSTREIRDRYGSEGVTGYASPDGKGRITDDTQMTLFTAEGLIRARNRDGIEDLDEATDVLNRAYLRWLLTQTRDESAVPWMAGFEEEPAGWLIDQKELWVQRAPGATCLSALRSGQMGSPGVKLNDSKGCGGVMRVAPVGLVAPDPFELGLRAAAITHTHPSGYLAAGAFAQIIAELCGGSNVVDAVSATIRRLGLHPGAGETVEALNDAVALALVEPDAQPEAVERLGGGWVAEEALAIAIYCALTAADFGGGVLAAVNHSGDSDSTGAICGNLLGTVLGTRSVPQDWIADLAEADLVERVAADLAADTPDTDRYPPW